MLRERYLYFTARVKFFARYFKTTPPFWMNMQMHYEFEVAEDELAAKIERDVHPFEPTSTR